MDSTRTARLLREAGRLAAAKPPRWSLALRLGRLHAADRGTASPDLQIPTGLSVAGSSGN